MVSGLDTFSSAFDQLDFFREILLCPLSILLLRQTPDLWRTLDLAHDWLHPAEVSQAAKCSERLGEGKESWATGYCLLQEEALRRLMCVLSRVQLFATPWTVAHQALSMEFSRWEILEWVAISSSRGSSRRRDWTCVSYVSCIDRQILYHLCHLWSPTFPLLSTYCMLSASKYYLNEFFFFLDHTVQHACGILVPQPDIKPMPHAVEAQSLNHWTSRESLTEFLQWMCPWREETEAQSGWLT